ncbi:uncharacterized protein LOC18436282 [Amborella trichopoda]|uniref:uncharacterized protein LOC18436282 n=1 Tax=Amborella trichopoda TaxID=13333 RepID=UPI0005D31A65|nr:uncharacterized protein LOC18436282 [Amborella trichopoda]|eukprot:XP_011624182.1 uncharacterized protein LOC18436282 [Amborella trichopoda]
MGFISFAGRVLFSSIFILAAWQRFNEFADDGGPAVKLLEPKYSLVKNHVTSSLGFQVPEIEIKHLVAAEIALKGIGGILFIFGSSFGAHLLVFMLNSLLSAFIAKMRKHYDLLCGCCIMSYNFSLFSFPYG